MNLANGTLKQNNNQDTCFELLVGLLQNCIGLKINQSNLTLSILLNANIRHDVKLQYAHATFDSDILKLNALLNGHSRYNRLYFLDDVCRYSGYGFIKQDGDIFIKPSIFINDGFELLELNECNSAFWVNRDISADTYSVLIITRSENKEKPWLASLLTSKPDVPFNNIYHQMFFT